MPPRIVVLSAGGYGGNVAVCTSATTLSPGAGQWSVARTVHLADVRVDEPERDHDERNADAE